MLTSLRSRLIGAAAIWVAAATAVAGLILSAIFRDHVTHQFYGELYGHLDELKSLTSASSDGAHVSRPLSDPRYQEPLSGYYWEIQREDKIVARSSSLQGPRLTTPPPDPLSATAHSHEIRGPTGALIIVEQAQWYNETAPPLRFIVGTDRRHIEAVVNRFDGFLISSLGVFAGSMILAAGLLILLALRPFRHLQAALAAVREGRSSQVRGRFPREVQPLVDDLNAMLRSMAGVTQRARAQAGKLAHGLKTPLAILTAEAHELEKQGLAHAASVILHECRRLQSQIDFQIARARAAASKATPGMVTSAGRSAREVASALARLYRDKELAILNSVPEAVLIACDGQDLDEMLGNLADNACKYAHTRVEISCAEEAPPGFVRLTVEDDGPGLPPEAWEVVFEIGERWGSGGNGGGLGLPIVRDLASLYGGAVSLSASPLGGLKVMLDLPAPPATLKPG